MLILTLLIAFMEQIHEINELPLHEDNLKSKKQSFGKFLMKYVSYKEIHFQ